MTGRQGPHATVSSSIPTGIAPARRRLRRAAARTSRRDLPHGRPGRSARPAPAATSRARPTRRSCRPGSVTGRSLTLVITIMCFLACLTAGAVYMMNQSASAWLRDIASEVTVQVEVKNRTDVDKFVADVTRFLSQQPGIVTARPLSVARFRAAARALARTDRRAQRAADPAHRRRRARSRQSARLRPAALDLEPRVQGRDARRPSPLAGADPHHHALLRAGRPRHPAAGGRRHHRRDRLGHQERHGVEPRHRRGAAFRRRHRPLHRPRVRASLPAARA